MNDLGAMLRILAEELDNEAKRIGAKRLDDRDNNRMNQGVTITLLSMANAMRRTASRINP